MISFNRIFTGYSRSTFRATNRGVRGCFLKDIVANLSLKNEYREGRKENVLFRGNNRYTVLGNAS